MSRETRLVACFATSLVSFFYHATDLVAFFVIEGFVFSRPASSRFFCHATNLVAVLLINYATNLVA